MVSTEVWMGSGQSVTLAPESELFLGYMSLGPTLGRTGTNKAHLIKYSLGYALNGTNVTVGTTKKFSDYYELVPDLYTGCTAKFFYPDEFLIISPTTNFCPLPATEPIVASPTFVLVTALSINSYECGAGITEPLASKII